MHDRKWVGEVVDHYLTFEKSEADTAWYRDRAIDTLMSVTTAPPTNSAKHCSRCRERYIKSSVASTFSDEIYAMLQKQQSDDLLEVLLTTAAGELTDYGRLLTEDEIQYGSTSVDHKPRHSGVYFLLQGDHVVYVGQAKNVKKRIAEHKADPEKVFDAYSFLPCDAEDLDTLEALYIMHLRPKQNKRQPGLYNILRATRKLPKNLKMPDAEAIQGLIERESTE